MRVFISVSYINNRGSSVGLAGGWDSRVIVVTGLGAEDVVLGGSIPKMDKYFLLHCFHIGHGDHSPLFSGYHALFLRY